MGATEPDDVAAVNRSPRGAGISLRTRLLLAAMAVLLAFVFLCDAALEKSFRDAALEAQEKNLRGLVYTLLGAADDIDGKLEINDGDLPEPRLMRKESGLEAAVLEESGKILWRSPSQSGSLPVVIGPDVGHWKFERIEETGQFALSMGLRWIGEHNKPQRYTVLALEDTDDFDAHVALYERTLHLWLGAASIGLLAALLLVQMWGLRPLRRLVGELRSVESGAAPHVAGRYPAELMPLTGALNAMIVSERNQLQRYRNALGDLAHSLKTPLAVLRGLSADERLPGEPRRQLEEQVGRMQQIADHQLSRAATAGRRALMQPVAVQPVAEKLVAALKKVYASKGLRFDLVVSPKLQGRIDGGDLYELLGNTLDNAAKWAKSRVRCSVARDGSALRIAIEDDGAGFPDDPERLLGRGVRADSRVPGQGLGLASVAEIVSAYEGRIVLERSAELGGARLVMTVPSA